MLLHYGFLWVLALLILSGLLLIGFGVWAFGLRRKLMCLASEDELARRFGCDTARLRSAADDRGILPKYNVNNRDYYDPAEFGDAATLLRAASQPTELLRPAGNAELETDYLLHPVNASEAVVEERRV